MPCSPKAATRFPLIATCCSTPVVPDGNGRTILVQVVPLVVVHTAGWPLSDPDRDEAVRVRGDLAGAAHVGHVIGGGPGGEVG